MKTFDPELHVYRVPTGRLPGATDVIKSEGLIDSDWMTEEARWRGKCVHRAIELFNENDLVWETVDYDHVGYIRSYEKFLAVSKFKFLGGEKPCFDGAFACIPDLWGMLNGWPTLIELKTGPIPKWTAIQTALQKRALSTDIGFRVIKRFGLRLMADGSLAKLDPFDDPADDRAAMSMVETFHWKLNHGYIKNWRTR